MQNFPATFTRHKNDGARNNQRLETGTGKTQRPIKSSPVASVVANTKHKDKPSMGHKEHSNGKRGKKKSFLVDPKKPQKDKIKRPVPNQKKDQRAINRGHLLGPISVQPKVALEDFQVVRERIFQFTDFVFMVSRQIVQAIFECTTLVRQSSKQNAKTRKTRMRPKRYIQQQQQGSGSGSSSGSGLGSSSVWG